MFTPPCIAQHLCTILCILVHILICDLKKNGQQVFVII